MKGKKDKLDKDDKHGVEDDKPCTDCHPSPVIKPLLKNKSQVLHIIVNALLGPLQEVVTARNRRSLARRSRTGSPIRRHAYG